jgi:predicted Rdx family selenoprotein
LGYCRRTLGTLTAAEEAYVNACKIAKRHREQHRLYRSQIGLASVITSRGNLPQADAMLKEIVQACGEAGFRDVSALALHDHSIIAHQRGDFDSAVCRAYQALQLTDSDGQRERILGDLGAFFVSMGRFQAARDALLVEEATAVAMQARTVARINLLSLAARLPDQSLFEAYRQKLSNVALAPDMEANFLIECARGLRLFDNAAEAKRLLERARDIAIEHELHRSAHEAETMLAETVIETPIDRRPTMPSAAAVRVETELRTMAAALAA